MARASIDTLLSLDRYAQLIGFNPAHFNSAFSPSANAVSSSCNDIWFQHTWQNPGFTSREELARAIRTAEDDIADVLGYYPAPRFHSAETAPVERFYRPELIGTGLLQPNGSRASVRLDGGKVIAPGRRAVAFAVTAAVYCDDTDSDGVVDVARVTATIPAASAAVIVLSKPWFSGTLRQHLGVYFKSKDGDEEWKIRDPLSWKITPSGADYILEATYRPWQLIVPELWEAFPTADEDYQVRAIEYSATGRTVLEVDVYLEYPNISADSVEFTWDLKDASFVGATNATESVHMVQQGGFFTIRDTEAGIIVPIPATYNATTDTWDKVKMAQVRNPNFVRVWYYGGERSSGYLSGKDLDPLSHSLAEAVAWLATARLALPVCGCGNTLHYVNSLQRDLAIVSPQGNFIIGIDEVMNNPFGTKTGEVLAWRRVRRLTERRIEGGSI